MTFCLFVLLAKLFTGPSEDDEETELIAVVCFSSAGSGLVGPGFFLINMEAKGLGSEEKQINKKGYKRIQWHVPLHDHISYFSA